MDADTQAQINQLNRQIRELKKQKSSLKWGATPNKTNDKHFDRWSKMTRYLEEYGKDENGKQKAKGKRNTITMEMLDFITEKKNTYVFLDEEDNQEYMNFIQGTSQENCFQTMRDWAQERSNELGRPVKFNKKIKCEFQFDFVYNPEKEPEEKLECPICYQEKLETNFVCMKCDGNHKICKTCIKKHKDSMRRQYNDMKCPMCNHNFGRNPQESDCWNNITISDRYR